MKNKGFTLVELLAVIVILSLVSVIVFPNINSVIMSSRQKLHEDQIKDIEKAGKKWATDNSDSLDKYHINIAYISLNDLQKIGYLEKDRIVDPIEKKEMNGCVEIKYNSDVTTETSDDKKTSKTNVDNYYSYVYAENSCSDYAATSMKKYNNEYGYVIYTYDSASKSLIKDESSKEYKPLGLEIYENYLNNNILHAEGEEADGLYDADDYYVFKGSNPLNYIKLSNGSSSVLFRIISINKKNYTIKAVKASSITTNSWTTKDEKLQAEDYGNSKILLADYLSGKVDDDNYSISSLNSNLASQNKTNQKISMLSILDYVNASATYDCTINFKSDQCRNNNYMFNMIGTGSSAWTINTNSDNSIWYIGDSGLSLDSNPATNRKIFSVITLNYNVYNSNNNATGDEKNAYIVK